jgi:hypothetical protein
MNPQDKFGSIIKGHMTQNQPAPVKSKFGVAKFSDLHGSTNPTGIISPAFLLLKQSLDRGDNPAVVLDALYDWISNRTQRGIKRTELDKLLKLKPELALSRLISLIGAGLNQKSLPPLVIQTLKRTLQHAANLHVHKREQRMKREQSSISGIRTRYGVESAAQLAASLLEG